jgi:hypothetical protein
VAWGLTRKSLRRFAVTILLSAAGGLAATLIGLPAGWVAGGLVTVAVASLAGVNTDFPMPFRAPVYLLLGIYSGTGVTQETLHQMQTWPASFAILAVSVVALIASSYWWLHGRCGWDRNAALLSSLPGALSFVMAAAEGLKADLKKVAISQSIRLLVLVEIIPLVALLLGDAPEHAGSAPAAAAAATAGPIELLILFGAGLAAALLLEWVRLPGGWMLGGLLASAALFLSGTLEARPPFLLILPGMIAIAAISGSRFRPGDMVVLPRIAGPALAAFGMASVISVAGAALVTLIFDIGFDQTFLAFAPGALDVLVILAYQMDIDPAYVAAHHVVRFLALALTVPILARWLEGRP